MTAPTSIRPYLNQAYLLGLLMVAVGLTLSPFLMGMSQFWLVIVWVVDGICTKSFKEKLSRFWYNKAAVLLVAFYLMHVVGLLWTSDFDYALRDLRVKLPILVMPFVLSSMEPLDRKRFNFVMLVYVLSVFVATVFSSMSYWRHDYEDVREISHFISHIRFCLNIVFCIAIILWYIVKTKVPEPAVPKAHRRVEGPTHKLGRTPVPDFGVKFGLNRFLQYFLLFWFIYQIFIFESLSGYVILACLGRLCLPAMETEQGVAYRGSGDGLCPSCHRCCVCRAFREAAAEGGACGFQHFGAKNRPRQRLLARHGLQSR